MSSWYINTCKCLLLQHAINRHGYWNNNLRRMRSRHLCTGLDDVVYVHVTCALVLMTSYTFTSLVHWSWWRRMRSRHLCTGLDDVVCVHVTCALVLMKLRSAFAEFFLTEFNWIATPNPNYIGNPGWHRTRKPMAYRVSCYPHSPHLNIPEAFKIVIYLILETYLH